VKDSQTVRAGRGRIAGNSVLVAIAVGSNSWIPRSAVAWRMERIF